MGLPSINITFRTTASESISYSEKGVVAIILLDSAGTGAYTLTNTTQIPTALSAANQAYLTRAFRGYVNPPRKIIVWVGATGADTLADGLAYMATRKFDYLAGPPDLDSTGAAAIASWIADQRGSYNAVFKAVLPDTAADSEAVVNFTSDGMTDGTNTYTTAQYCSRIAGILAGTPMTISCTYAPVPELSDLTRLTKAEMDTAVDAGQLILMYDGEKVKIARGVNSLTTTTAGKGGEYQKIKIVEAMDMITQDIRTTAQDQFIGKYSCSYDNKCVLISAISDYLTVLENKGILQGGGSSVGIDTAAQTDYLVSQGVDTSALTEQQIKEYDTGDQVFLSADITILDAMESITLAITI